MKTIANAPLAPLTSLAVGGEAELLFLPTNDDEVIEAASNCSQFWTLGYGTNSLIASEGLHGHTIRIVNGTVTHSNNLVIVDAGVWWDNLVEYAIEQNLWGLECMSAIPGGVGGAIVGNIAAYGQAVSDTLVWIEVYDSTKQQVRKIIAEDLNLSYRHSILQNDSHRSLIVLRAAFELTLFPAKSVSYQRLVDAANEIGADLETLIGRRSATILARRQAGSLWDYRDEIHESNNAGSFFRNPLVSSQQAEQIIAHDESGIATEQIKKMNQIHGGDALRVSAAHVMLAAGYNRGQAWGNIRLHPDHVLKIETLSGATADELYAVVNEIISTVKDKIDVELVPEPRMMGF